MTITYSYFAFGAVNSFAHAATDTIQLTVLSGPELRSLLDDQNVLSALDRARARIGAPPGFAFTIANGVERGFSRSPPTSHTAQPPPLEAPPAAPAPECGCHKPCPCRPCACAPAQPSQPAPEEGTASPQYLGKISAELAQLLIAPSVVDEGALFTADSPVPSQGFQPFVTRAVALQPGEFRQFLIRAARPPVGPENADVAVAIRITQTLHFDSLSEEPDYVDSFNIVFLPPDGNEQRYLQ